jgi:hypothetical protein
MMKALIIIPTLALFILNLADGAPTKTRNVYSEKGAYAGISWKEKEDCPESRMYFQECKTVSNVQADGKPETSEGSCVVHYDRFYDCSNNGVKHANVRMDIADDEAPPSATVAISNDLKSGSISSTYPAIIYKESCKKECVTNPDEPTHCWTTDCKAISEKKTKVTFNAKLVGTGEIHEEALGPARTATISIALTAKNGTPMPVPSNAQISGYMYRKSN